jgi:hypothetical protein
MTQLTVTSPEALAIAIVAHYSLHLGWRSDLKLGTRSYSCGMLKLGNSPIVMYATKMALIRLWPETGSWNMALTTMNLRLEAADGVGTEEYRVHDGEIEVRTSCSLDPSYGQDEWRRLSANEIASHVRENTAVAQWLRHRIGWRQLVLACTDKDTLEMYGVSKTPIDRHAA